MKTNEVIKYFENYLKAVSLIGSPESKQDKMFRGAITLLKRGEKYEKMWEEDAKDWLGNDLDLEEWMNETKQKYFPERR